MPAILSVFSTALLLAAIFLALRKKERQKSAAPGPAGTLEYRTSLALDDCLDRLRQKSEGDLFAYTCEREPDGSFLLHFTLHRPTSQPLDTLYRLRLEAGRRTVVTVSFVREAFGYREPVFPQKMLDEFLLAKLEARPAPPPEG